MKRSISFSSWLELDNLNASFNPIIGCYQEQIDEIENTQESQESQAYQPNAGASTQADAVVADVSNQPDADVIDELLQILKTDTSKYTIYTPRPVIRAISY